MSTNTTEPQDDDPVDSPPGYEYNHQPGRDVWTHRETGLEVEIRKRSFPDQMHDPQTAERDEGYQAWVYGDDGAETLTRARLGHRGPLLDVAASFMAEFPDGEYETVVETLGAHGPARWRQVAEEGR